MLTEILSGNLGTVEPPREWTSEQSLIAAQIAEIIYCALGKAHRGIDRAKEQRRALRYIFTKDESVGSFTQLCDIINIEAGYVRRLLRRELNAKEERKRRVRSTGYLRRIK